MLTTSVSAYSHYYRNVNISFKGNEKDKILEEQMNKYIEEYRDELEKNKNKNSIKKIFKEKVNNYIQKIIKFWTTQSSARKIAIQSLFALLIACLSYAGGLFTRPATIEVQKQKIENLNNKISATEEEFASKEQEVKNLDSKIGEKRQEVAKLDSGVEERIRELDSINAILAEKIKQNKILEQPQNDSSGVNTGVNTGVNIQKGSDEQLLTTTETNSMDSNNEKKTFELNIDTYKLCEDGNLEAFSKIVENYPDFDINKSNNNGRSYMYKAIKYDRNGNHKKLINYIAGIKSLDAGIPHMNGHTDMYYMCVGGYDEAVQIYFDNHPDFDVNNHSHDNNCRSYMFRAIDNDRNGSHRKLINVLAGVRTLDANILHQNGHSDMYYWCAGGYTEAVQIYFDTHPDFDIEKYGDYYIKVAQKYKHYDIVNLLIDFRLKKK